MLKRLRRWLRRGYRSRSTEAQLAELRAAVSALVQHHKSTTGSAAGGQNEAVEIDGMLLHAANARVQMEQIGNLYGSVASRLAALERRVDAIAARPADRK